MKDKENYIRILFTQQAYCMVLINELMEWRICDPNEKNKEMWINFDYENSAGEVLLGELRRKRETKSTVACYDVN